MNPEPEEPYLGYYPDAELVIALVCPLGTAYQRVIETLENYLGQFKYRTNVIHLRSAFRLRKKSAKSFLVNAALDRRTRAF